MKRRRYSQQIMRRTKRQVEAEDKGKGRVKDNLQICSLEAKKRAMISMKIQEDQICEEQEMMGSV